MGSSTSEILIMDMMMNENYTQSCLSHFAHFTFFTTTHTLPSPGILLLSQEERRRLTVGETFKSEKL